MAHFEFVGKDHIKRCCLCPLEECSLDCSLRRKLVNKPTNADRIRSMSDEELATWLVCNAFKNIDGFLNDMREQANISVSYPKDEKRLFENTLKWLKEKEEVRE